MKKNNYFLKILIILFSYPSLYIPTTIIFLFCIISFFAPYLSPYNPNEFVGNPIEPPQKLYILGTDPVGRDILSRIIYGSRISLSIGLISTLISTLVSTLFAILAGLYKGYIDTIIMRITDGFLAFPTIIIALGIISITEPSILSISIAISLSFTPKLLRIIRSEVMIVINSNYVEAARAIGISNLNLTYTTILPNIMSPILVGFSVFFSTAVILEAGLSFLGFGVTPPTATWGYMINRGFVFIRQAPWISVFPGIAIFIFALSLNRLGDSIRDIFDPRMNIRSDL